MGIKPAEALSQNLAVLIVTHLNNQKMYLRIVVVQLRKKISLLLPRRIFGLMTGGKSNWSDIELVVTVCDRMR